MSLWVLVPFTIVAGLRYPLVGFVVPAVMIVGIVGGFLKGRYVCGWLCPRGAFYDRIMRAFSPVKRIPNLFRRPIFRWSVLALLMGLTVLRISQNPSDPYHWGAVFVRVCLITTAVGVLLALIIHPRAWCTFCPMGTLQAAAGGGKKPLKMGDGCAECRLCEGACPINLTIVGGVRDGRLASRDCLKCPECQLACPKGILSFR